ncbi:MAG TPA: DUF4288 domain-containing protein [Candidatus Limnocylindria bacterium]|nr:DUF4288 domain-containing protein [Candidatus Limnocylindria bacterium]
MTDSDSNGRNGHTGSGQPVRLDELDALEPIVDPSGWFSVQLRYAYLVGARQSPAMIEDRVVLVDGEDEETALGRAVEIAVEYEDEFETEAGDSGIIRFEGIVAIKELDDPPAAGTEVWHEFMAPAGVETDADGEPLPPVRPMEMAFPRAHDE